MSIKLILEFEEIDRNGIYEIADLIAAEAENLTGEAPLWKVKEPPDDR